MPETNRIKRLIQSFQGQYIEARMVHYAFEVILVFKEKPCTAAQTKRPVATRGLPT